MFVNYYFHRSGYFRENSECYVMWSLVWTLDRYAQFEPCYFQNIYKFTASFSSKQNDINIVTCVSYRSRYGADPALWYRVGGQGVSRRPETGGILKLDGKNAFSWMKGGRDHPPPRHPAGPTKWVNADFFSRIGPLVFPSCFRTSPPFFKMSYCVIVALVSVYC